MYITVNFYILIWLKVFRTDSRYAIYWYDFNFRFVHIN